MARLLVIGGMALFLAYAVTQVPSAHPLFLPTFRVHVITTDGFRLNNYSDQKRWTARESCEQHKADIIQSIAKNGGRFQDEWVVGVICKADGTPA